jgi:hypothetical protein
MKTVRKGDIFYCGELYLLGYNAQSFEGRQVLLVIHGYEHSSSVTRGIYLVNALEENTDSIFRVKKYLST